MIPLSVVDARIDYLEAECWVIERGNFPDWVKTEMHLLQEIKKEAIPSPSGHWDSKCQCMCHQDHQGLEQKIKDRIAFLETAIIAGTSDLVTRDGVAWSKELHQTKIDELRKLVEK